jgi:hypothetical protein
MPVAMSVHATHDRRDDSQGKHESGSALDEKRDLRGHSEHLLPSEAEVLECLSRLAVQSRRATLVPPPSREIALGDPRGGAMRGR